MHQFLSFVLKKVPLLVKLILLILPADLNYNTQEVQKNGIENTGR